MAYVLPLEIDSQSMRYINWDLTILKEHKELEIGFGNGDYIFGLANNKKNVDFVGIEYNPKYFLKGLKKAIKYGGKNLFLAKSEAKSFIYHVIPDNFFDAVHINFPDPWPKKRHIERRLIDMPFVEEIKRILKPFGKLYVATDFFEYFLNIVSFCKMSCLEIIYNSEKPYAERMIKTKYEKHFEATGAPIFYGIFKKNS